MLLKNDPADPFMNYYYGVCMFKLNQNKAKVINSLLVATGIKEIPADVWYYLGKSYHLSYLFSDAIKAFEKYKELEPKKKKIAENKEAAKKEKEQKTETENKN